MSASASNQRPFRMLKGVSVFSDLADGMNLMPGVGNVYFVVQAANSNPYSKLIALQRQYEDWTNMVHTTIASALTATADQRNDYVIVMPDPLDYDVGATTTLDKDSVHLICPAGIGCGFGNAGMAAVVDPNGAFHGITITGRSVEVAGLRIRGATEKICITTDGVGSWIHHNDCAVTCTTSAAGGIQATSNAQACRIENNFIYSNAGAGTWLYGIQVHPSCTRSQINSNLIHVSNASTCTNGIDTTNIGTSDGAAMFTVFDNVLAEAPAFSSTAASTLSCGIRAGQSVMVARNLIGLATEANAVIGGTANSTFITNYEASSGGTLAI